MREIREGEPSHSTHDYDRTIAKILEDIICYLEETEAMGVDPTAATDSLKARATEVLEWTKGKAFYQHLWLPKDFISKPIYDHTEQPTA